MNLVVVQIQLDLLDNFLKHVTAEAGQELDAIESRRLSGNFASFEDYEHEVDLPIACIGIAARAVAHELVVLVEGELHQLAHEPWVASAAHKGPKNIQQLSHVNPETLAKLRMVSDLPFDEVVGLIEDHFGIALADVEGWSAIRELRGAVNAFKHRRGFKHPRDVNWWSKDGGFGQRHSIDQQETMKALANVASFFRALKLALERQPGNA